MMTLKHFTASLALFAFAGLAQASPKITGLVAGQKSVAKGQSLTFTVKGEGLENAVCALRVSYGDGTSTVRHLDWGKNVKFPLPLKKTYDKAGKYSAQVVGVKSGNILKCLGSARVSIHVTEPPVAP